MKSSEEFKQKLHDKEFAKLLTGIKSAKDVVKFARENGYIVSEDEVKNSELSDDMLENIAGGKEQVTEIHLHFPESNQSK